MSKLFAKLIVFCILVCTVSACQNEEGEDVTEQAVVNHEFVGSKSCINCHQSEFQDWQRSHHFQAMRDATPESVLADFSGIELVVHEVNYRFYTRQDQESLSYWVSITEQSGEIVDHQISYTFGFDPLQQYLVEFDNGHIQALNMAWDSRSNDDGGQRWFHLRPDESMSKENIFHWERHYQNWNNRCADCHSTGLEKNYDVVAHRYDTQWSEVNVACEACHGPASEHIRLVQQDNYQSTQTGFVTTKLSSLNWYFRDNANIASPVANDQMQSNEIDMCGACHSFRSSLAQSGKSYHDQHRLQVMDDNAYFADGQIKQETFVLGSFLQSKMHANGVTCANCHKPHSGEVLIEGNGLCLQCHAATAYETEVHHQHTTGTEGAQCINCHMPDRIYMEVDARRDHSFVVPNADLSETLDSPNPCLSCHQDKDQAWLQRNIKTTPIDDHWAITRQAAQNGEIVIDDIQTYLESDQSSMRNAALLSSLAANPTQASFNVAKQHLDNVDPLVRRSAIASMANMPLTVLLPNALKLINDPVRSVRFEALSTLLANYQQLSDQQRFQMTSIVEEYKQSLEINSDSPEGQLALASFAISQLDFEAAELAYQRAVVIEPNYIPALINFADFYRATNRDGLGRNLLEKTIELEPSHSGANFAYAMLLIRAQEKETAIQHLRISSEQIDSTPYYHYVYAVGLNDLGQTEDALAVIANALNKWPKDLSLLELSGQLGL